MQHHSSSSSSSFTHPPPTTTRLIRLLRPYTTQLRAFSQLLEDDGNTAAGPSNATPATPSPFVVKQKRSQRTYVKRRRLDDDVVPPPQAFQVHSNEDVFVSSQPNASAAPPPRRHYRGKFKAIDDVPPVDCRHLETKLLRTAAKPVIQSFRNILHISFPTTKTSPTDSAKHGSSSLSALAAHLVGKHLDDWLTNDMEESDDQQEEMFKIADEKLDRLRVCLEWIPIAALSQVFLDHCLTLALALPNHPGRLYVLWPLLHSLILLEHHQGVNRLIPHLIDSADSLTESYILELADVLATSPPYIHRTLGHALINSISKFTVKALSLIPNIITMSGQVNVELAGRVMCSLLTVVEENEYSEVEGTISTLLNNLSEMLIAAREAGEWSMAWWVIKKFLESHIHKGEWKYRRTNSHPLLYLWSIILLAFPPPSDPASPQRNNRKLIAILSSLRVDPGISYHLLPTDILPVSTALSVSSCPHVDSWILLRAIEDGASNLADRLQDAERRTVELEMRNGTPWKGEKRKGWIWDDVIESWVEKPASTVKKRKPAHERTRPPNHERQSLQPVGRKRVKFDNIPQTASPLSKFLQRATGNTTSKGSSRPSKPARIPSLPSSPLPIGPPSDDPLGDISNDSPHQLSHRIRAQESRQVASPLAAWTRQASHKTPSKLVATSARLDLSFSSPSSPLPITPESDDPLADLSASTPRWNHSSRTVREFQQSPLRKGWGSKRSYDSHLESSGRTAFRCI